MDIKILSHLLDRDYAARSSLSNVYTIVGRYLYIKNDIKPTKSLVSDNYSGYIQFRYMQAPTGVYDGWERLNTASAPIEQYLRKFCGNNVVVLRNNDQQQTQIFMTGDHYNHRDNKAAMDLITVYPQLVPWLSPTPLDEEDKAFINALIAKDEGKIIEITNALVDRKLGNLEEKVANQAFAAFKIDPSLTTYNHLESQIANLNDEIYELTSQLTAKYENLRSLQEAVRAISLGSHGDSSDLAKFFKQHKQLRISTYSSDDITFTISETIQNYSDKIGRYIDNPNTILGSASPELRKVLKYCLVNKKAKIKVYSRFLITKEGVVRVVQGAAEDDMNAISHPHLIAFGCLGTNAAELNNYNAAGEWDMGIEQAIAATRNINIDDSAAMRQFITSMRSNKRCILMPDGSIITPGELVKIINKEEQSNAES